MASFKCKKCGSVIPIKKEWLEEGIKKLIQCESCGNKMKLNLPPVKAKEQSGTVILTKDSKKSSPEKFTIRSKDTFDFHLTQKQESYKVLFGRNPNASNEELDECLIINDPFISREHGLFTIFKSKGEMKITLEDLGSSNGTFLNGNKVNNSDVVYVEIGDEILAGNTVINVQ
ncbi:FHA domain-containing protein [Gramella sp. KN1008]|uniref:FHA domain-containing protein n=1 Tax=Gramella sp. KN1008 TaxID=2529298 RepID=UPI001038D09D|nr:FHA domain-containing protein [Gramella sp. KN1008]TBW28255.1 FHA domain-containing protein [Gramella sp. KN1008]